MQLQSVRCLTFPDKRWEHVHGIYLRLIEVNMLRVVGLSFIYQVIKIVTIVKLGVS